MMLLDPAPGEVDQRGYLSIGRRYRVVRRADKQPAYPVRELVLAVAVVEKGEPGRAGQRSNALTRKDGKRSPAHQNGQLRGQFDRRRLSGGSALDPFKFRQ